MKKTVKLGLFGFGRGGDYVKNILANNFEIVAVCENQADKAERAKKMLGDVAIYRDFDAMLDHNGLEAVFLCNYFHEHAEAAIKALAHNIHVLSECTSNATMAQGVALVRAAEKSKAIYMLAENYPYMRFNREMRRVYRGGSLGKVLFAEGEYNHSVDPSNSDYAVALCPHSKHWRYWLPKTYYITHSLAPLMYITGATPRRVTAFPVYGTFPVESERGNVHLRAFSGAPERAAVVTCFNDDESVFRVTGGAFGFTENSYRICGEKGQIENVRGTDKVMLQYNSWDIPEGGVGSSLYRPEGNGKDEMLIGSAGHGGGDFLVMREFYSCVTEGRQPDFDVYFATTMASVGILGFRSMLEHGVPYDVPDFHNEQDRVRYEKDDLTPFWASDGSAPNIMPTGRDSDHFTPEGMARYDRLVAEVRSRKPKQ